MALQPLRPEDPPVIGGYRLLGRLGGGGMGQVFLGRSPGGRPVAVKLVLPGLSGDDGFRRRFAQEVEAARRVGGFHTAQVVDADPTADPPWLVTAYVPGPSLQEAVGAHGPLPLRTVQILGAGLAEGLAAIHSCGLVHRDLKPGNVILAADGPRIIDFGIARATDGTALTAAGSVIGTPGFMSPEQAGGTTDLGPASDVFALGSVLTFAARGRGPFDGGSVATVVHRIVTSEPDLEGVPQPLRDLVAACLAKDPAARPAVADLLRDLSAAVPDAGTDSWLPPAVTAMIAERDASAVADTLPPSTPTGPGGPASVPPPPAGGAPSAGSAMGGGPLASAGGMPPAGPAMASGPSAPPGPAVVSGSGGTIPGPPVPFAEVPPPPGGAMPPGGPVPYPGPGAQGGGGWAPPAEAWSPPAGPAGGWQGPPGGLGQPGGHSPMSTPTYPGITPHGSSSGLNGTKIALAGALAFVLVCLAGVVFYLVSDTEEITAPPAVRTIAPTGDASSGAVDPPVTGGTPQGPSSPSQTPQEETSVRDLVGTWEGTYTCNQGLTGMRLTIKEASSGDGLEAVFDFFEHPSNPGVPSGSVAMRGTLVDRNLELHGDRWINRPAGYLMVDLRARVPKGRPSRIIGTVVGSNCTTFIVRRV